MDKYNIFMIVCGGGALGIFIDKLIGDYQCSPYKMLEK